MSSIRCIITEYSHGDQYKIKHWNKKCKNTRENNGGFEMFSFCTLFAYEKPDSNIPTQTFNICFACRYVINKMIFLWNMISDERRKEDKYILVIQKNVSKWWHCTSITVNNQLSLFWIGFYEKTIQRFLLLF